jgi:enoyl-CoA hydratase/carnithine racemase
VLELLLSGNTIDAATAHRWGLVDEVVPAADLATTDLVWNSAI